MFMGSPSDMDHCEKIRAVCKTYGVPCDLRVSSAHKGTEETIQILAQYEGLSGLLMKLALEKLRRSRLFSR